jgi:hypothetical protein
VRQHSALIRERVVARTLDMLEHLRIQVSCLPKTEIDMDALKKLERPQQFDLAEVVARCVMEQLYPQDPRFDKTRRTVNQQIKSLRGDGDATT